MHWTRIEQWVKHLRSIPKKKLRKLRSRKKRRIPTYWAPLKTSRLKKMPLCRRVHHRNQPRQSKSILENLARMPTPSRRPKRIRSRCPRTMESPRKRRSLDHQVRNWRKARKKRRLRRKSITQVMLKRLFRESKSKIQAPLLPASMTRPPSWMIIRATRLFLKGRTSLWRRKMNLYRTRVPPKISSTNYCRWITKWTTPRNKRLPVKTASPKKKRFKIW